MTVPDPTPRLVRLTATVLAPIPHGFFTRQGGVSIGRYASLNAGFGSKDDPAAVRENRRRIAAQFGLPGSALLTVRQTHSTDVCTVTAPWAEVDSPPADAMVTDQPGVLLGVLTADCAPVLFADHQVGVIGGAHAGWRGAIGGILGNTVAAMVDLGARADRIVAVIGPTIGPASYEVGPEFVERFCGADASQQRFFTPSPRAGHALFDLPAFCAAQLSAAGVRTVEVVAAHPDADADTYANPARWFSHRYNTHHGIGDYGRLVGCIGFPSNEVRAP